MNRIRIANSRFYSSLAFREVASLDWVEYTEATPQENAQALHEGLVDLAHIPVSEFAMHGGYVGIDFGVSTVKQIDSVMLFAQQPIDKLKTIYLDAGASTSVVLLQLLLAEKWMLTPKMLRVERQSLLESVGGTNGVLIIGDAALSCRDKFPVAIDLTSVWYQLTGLPFVYTIWAKRPGTLSKEQGRCIDELFHRHAKIRTTLATRYHNEVHVPMPDALHYIERIKHYLDDSTIQGLNEFISRAARLKLLPDCRYKTARYNILNNRAAKLRRRTSVNDLLERSVEGKRLGIHDGMRLAEEASLADLGLIADLLRTRLFATRSVSVAYRPDITAAGYNTADILHDGLDETPNLLVLDVKDSDLQNIEVFEDLISSLRERYKLDIEAFTVPQILKLSQISNISVKEVVFRLVNAGLNVISGVGGGMLIDRIMIKEDPSLPSVSVWLDTLRWAHRFGAQTTCCLRVSPNETWEERLIHLQKLRRLQDETPGVKAFYTYLSREWDRPALSEVKIRATIISRLFLDNIPYFQEPALADSPVLGMMGLSFGANEIRIEAAGDSPEKSLKSKALLSSLARVGLDIDEKNTRAPRPPVYH